MAKTARSATVDKQFHRRTAAAARFIGQQRRFVSHRSSRERFEAVRHAKLPSQKVDEPDGSM
jgi:hypothetical protein